MTEAAEQQTVIEYCDLRRIPVFHIPNGGSRNAKEAANLKRQGVKAGVPDLFIPRPSKDRHGLFIEMKTGTNKPTQKQVEWLCSLRREGYAAYICYGAENAIACIDSYLS